MKNTSALLFGYNGPRLNLAESDSHSVRKVLQKLGYWIPDEATRVGENATYEQLRKAAKFVSKEKPIGLLFFFAGHGTLIQGRNHIELADKVIPLETVKDLILEELPNLRRLVMIVDACRVVLGSPPEGPGFSPDAVTRSEERQQEPNSEPRSSVGGSPDTAYLFGCGWGKSSVETRGATHGIFTGALISEIESSRPSDPLLLRTLANRLKMPDEQQAAVIDVHGLALRTLGELPEAPPDTEVGKPIDSVACSKRGALCLAISGELEISVSHRGWMMMAGRFLSAGLAGPLFFMHAESSLKIKVNTNPRETSVDSDIGHFVSSPNGTWLAAVPQKNRSSRAKLYCAADVSEPADEVPVEGVQQMAFIDDLGNLLLMINAAGEVILHDRPNRTSSHLMGRSQPIHPARLASAPNGKWAAWCDWNGKLWIWSAEDGTIETVSGFAAPVTALAFGTNSTIALGLANGNVMLRPAANQRFHFKQLRGLSVEGFVTAMAFDQRDNFIVLGTSRGSVRTIPLRQGFDTKEHV